MVQIPAKPLNISELLDLPETEPASEYNDGRIIQKPMPQGEHSALQTELELGTQLPVPEFAKDFSLTVEGLFSWLLE